MWRTAKLVAPPEMTTATKVFNFSAGPAILPASVLQEAQRNLIALPGVGMSIMEISHRSKTFEAILADAVEQLRGKAFFVIQDGRLAAMRQRAAISVIVDQFVRGVRSDESTGSWHAKFALVRYLTPQGKAWRFWLGSRNLTVTSNLDFGLTLDGFEDAKDGVKIPNIRQVLRCAAEKAGLPKARVSKLLTACAKVRWSVPNGLSVLDLQLLPDSRVANKLPHFADADEVIVISPFLDGGFVSGAAGWASKRGSRRSLVSTESELRRLAHQKGTPLAAFKDNLLVLESPAREDTDPEPFVVDRSTPSEADAPEEELVVRGLHAKIFAVRHQSTWQLWVGSANATARSPAFSSGVFFFLR